MNNRQKTIRFLLYYVLQASDTELCDIMSRSFPHDDGVPHLCDWCKDRYGECDGDRKCPVTEFMDDEEE